MGFVGDLLSGNADVSLYSTIGTLIFITLFVGMLYYAYRIPAKELENYKRSIFDDQEKELLPENEKKN